METVPPERMPGEHKLEGIAAYEAAMDELIANTATTLRIFDRNLSRAFNTSQRAALLRKLLLANRNNRVYIIVHDTSNLVRDCPRLMQLLRQFSHALSINQTLPDARHVYDPFSIADDVRFVRRFHYNDARGVESIGDVAATSLLLMRFQELWGASAPAVAATTMGL